MASLNELYGLPEISVLKDEGISLDSIQQEMIADMEVAYEERTEESLVLYPADPYRMLINVVSGKIYQTDAIIDARFKQNFLAYMTLENTRQWGGNFGFTDNGEEHAKCIVRFTLSGTQENNVVIPQGTLVTAGDDIFFATDEEGTIFAGDDHVDLSTTFTAAGAMANNYSIGTINILSNTINYIESVSNITESSGGKDPYTNDELKERIINFPDTYSVSGPEGAYEQKAYEYSDEIVSTQAIANKAGVVTIFIMLANAKLPDTEYCDGVKAYFRNLGRFPDTDQLIVTAPTQIDYELEATYYISEYNKEMEDTIKAAVEEAVEEFTNATASDIGKAIVPDDLISYAKAAGARRITIVSPEYKTIGAGQIAICGSINLTYGGLEEN